MFFSSWSWGFGPYLVTAGSNLVQKSRRFESCEWAGLVPLLLQPRAEHLSSSFCHAWYRRDLLFSRRNSSVQGLTHLLISGIRAQGRCSVSNEVMKRKELRTGDREL